MKGARSSRVLSRDFGIFDGVAVLIGGDLSFMGQEAVESNIHSDAAITSTTCCEAPVCAEGDTEASLSFYSQSTAIVGDDVNDDAEFEKEMRLMLAGRHPQTTYSRKVFLGGLPHYSSSDDLQKFFSAFGAVEIVWPTESGDSEQETTTYGYAFAVFASAESVVSLLDKCANIGGKYSIAAPVSGKNNVAIHIRVWLNRNAEYCSDNSEEFMDVLTKNAVFVGGLPRTVTAKELFDFMSLTFGDVIKAKIEVEVETDYPKGAGCVVFRYRDSFLVAIARQFTSFKVADSYKKVELKPYLMRLTQCDICQKSRAHNFCPQLRCLKYMCESCWEQVHMDLENYSEHLPMVRPPPIHARNTISNSSIHWNIQKVNEALTGSSARAHSKVVEDNERGETNARSLYCLINSLPITPVPLLECASEPSKDWNTDCGMFDDRGPPPPHIRSRPVASARQLSQRPCFKKSGSESYSHQRSTQISNGPSRSRCPPLHNSRTYYNSARNASDRSHVRIGWTIGGNNMADLYSAQAPPGFSSWSDRISTLTSSSFSRPVVMPHLNHFVRARTSFSPTIRRPSGRTSNAQSQKPSNNTNDTNKDLGDNAAILVSQFQLF